jgi:hypothetical protein
MPQMPPRPKKGRSEARKARGAVTSARGFVCSVCTAGKPVLAVVSGNSGESGFVLLDNYCDAA